jgi:hypothetical protein
MQRFPALFSVLATAMLLAACTQAPHATLTRVDPFEKLLPETSWVQPFTETEDVAAGEHAVFQFALRGQEDLQDVRIQVSAPTDETGHQLTAFTAGFVEYVHVGRTTPRPGRDAIRSVTGLYPDPIVDDGQPKDIPAEKTQPLWVSIAIPADATPGTYTGTVRVSGRGLDLREPFSVKVWPVVLEEQDLWVTNWFDASESALHCFDPEAEMYSEAYHDFLSALAGQMKAGRQNTVLVPLSAIQAQEEDNTWTFDFSRFDAFIETFQKAGVLKRIEMGHIGTRTGLWNSNFGVHIPNRDDLLPIEDPVARNYYRQFFPALMAHLREKGWDALYCQHIADEPIADNVASYRAIAGFVKQVCPDIRIIEACHTHELTGVVDIWVPQLDFYAKDYAFYCERQAAGDEVWFYTCLAPQGDFANRFIEQPLLKTRLLHWINFRYGATGYLHWGLNQWRRGDPWKETTSINTESGNILPGGDSWIIYPGEGRLYGSLRLEAMRDGIADYTLLKMLARKDEARARELCRQMVYDWTVYDLSTAHFRAARHEILEALTAN